MNIYKRLVGANKYRGFEPSLGRMGCYHELSGNASTDKDVIVTRSRGHGGKRRGRTAN